jgi:hypothetical protein
VLLSCLQPAQGRRAGPLALTQNVELPLTGPREAGLALEDSCLGARTFGPMMSSPGTTDTRQHDTWSPPKRRWVATTAGNSDRSAVAMASQLSEKSATADAADLWGSRVAPLLAASPSSDSARSRNS